jgi:sugar lactone lactonase YvrE
MKIHLKKQYLVVATLLLAMVCFFTACTKRAIIPTSTKYNAGGSGTTVTDSTSADSIASFNAPTGVAVDAAGNVYVADYGNNQIRKISPSGVVSTLAGNGTQGSINGAGNIATFNGPTSVAVDQSGNIYVADANDNQIRKVTATGLVSTLAGSDSTGSVDGLGPAAYFFGPSGVATDLQGNVYVADAGNNLIRMVTPAGNTSTIAGNDNPGSNNGAGLAATFNNPTGLAVDASGNIYVADLLNNLIRKISGGQVTTLAGSDTTATINGVGTAAAFYFPNSVAVDASSNVYVTEYVTNLIRKIAPDGTVTTFAGSGAAGQADSTGVAASFNGPSGVAVDAAGNLYIADTYNNVIRKITAAGVVSTLAGSGNVGAINGKALSIRKGKGKTTNAVPKLNSKNTDLLFNILIKKHPEQYFIRSR